MKTLAFATALLLGGAAFAQDYGTTTTTEPVADPTMPAPVDPVPVTTAAAVPASAPVVQPSNANPEHDARGIAVISDVAYVPPGWNGIPAAGAMGGPAEGGDPSYPPCTAEVTDNCVQTYEVGSD